MQPHEEKAEETTEDPLRESTDAHVMEKMQRYVNHAMELGQKLGLGNMDRAAKRE